MANVDGLAPSFRSALMQLVAASGGRIKIGSGFRTRDEQARLYKAKPNLAAKPGHSNHERGLAADLIYADAAAQKWAHENAARFGLKFPMLNPKGKKYEPWHVEMATAPRSSYGATNANTAEKHAERHAAGLEDEHGQAVEQQFTVEYQLANLGRLLMSATDEEASDGTVAV